MTKTSYYFVIFVVKEFFYCFLVFFVYYLNKGVIHQRTQNFLESPGFHAVPV